MIIYFNRDTLLNSLVPVMNTVANKNTMACIEGIHIVCKDDKCLLESFDLEKGTRTYVDCEIEESGNCIINAQRLYNIVKVMPKGKIKLSVDTSFKVVIESEDKLSHFDIKALPGSEFPSLPELRGDRGFMFPQHLFRKFVNRVMFAIGQNDSRPVFNGAFFEITDNRIKLVACDGNRLAYCENDMEIENKNIAIGSKLNLKFIVPGKTLVEVLKLVKDTEEEMEIRLTLKYVLFKIGKNVIFSKTIDSPYIDYERILPKNPNLEIMLDAEKLRGALERSSLIVDDRLAGTFLSYVKFTIDEIMSISTQGANGNVFDEIAIEKIKGDSLVIGFNCKFLLDTLRVCDDGKMKISFVNQLMGTLIEPQGRENGKYLYFVMPLRMTH